MLEHNASLSSIRANFDGAAFSTYVLMTIIVPLKLWCRVRGRSFSGLGWDDGLIVLAMITGNIFFWISMMGVRPSIGLHYPAQVSDKDLERFLRSMFVAQLAMATSPFFSKAALLVFYWRLFSIKARTYILALWLVLLLWFFETFLASLLTCIPVRAKWDLSITDKRCLPERYFWIAGAGIGIATDIALLAMPVPVIWRLSAPLAQRIAVICAFLLGGFVTLVTVFRLANLITETSSKDPTYDFSDSLIWAMAEVHCKHNP